MTNMTIIGVTSSQAKLRSHQGTLTTGATLRLLIAASLVATPVARQTGDCGQDRPCPQPRFAMR
jgi:hypothetical protein